MAPKPGPRIRPSHDGLLLAQIRLDAGFLRHGSHGVAQCDIAVTIWMHKKDERLVGDFDQLSGTRHRHRRLPARGLLGGFRTRPGIQQRQFQPPAAAPAA